MSKLRIYSFYGHENTRFNINRFDKIKGNLIQYDFQPALYNKVYQRQAFTIFDALSRLGGVYSALFTSGLIFTSIFSYKLFMSSLIGRLFHFRPLGKKDTKKLKKRPKTKNIIIPKRKIYTKVDVEGNPYKFPVKTREDE